MRLPVAVRARLGSPGERLAKPGLAIRGASRQACRAGCRAGFSKAETNLGPAGVAARPTKTEAQLRKPVNSATDSSGLAFCPRGEAADLGANAPAGLERGRSVQLARHAVIFPLGKARWPRPECLVVNQKPMRDPAPHACPTCGCAEIWRSDEWKPKDVFMRLLRRVPYLCGECRTRFYDRRTSR